MGLIIFLPIMFGLPLYFIYCTFDLIGAFIKVARKQPVSPKKAKKEAENKT